MRVPVFFLLLLLCGCVTTNEIPHVVTTTVTSNLSPTSIADRITHPGVTPLNPVWWTAADKNVVSGFGIVWCMAGSTILKAGYVSTVYKRELKLSEAYASVASCFLPIVGGIIVERIFAANPHWDKLKTFNVDLRQAY